MNIDIDKIKRKMLIKYPFFGSAIANLKYVKDEEVKTASTDGDNIYYSEEFLSKLKPDEQVFVLAHETCHIVFKHVDRRTGKEPIMWNIACDAVINAFLESDGLPVLKDAVKIEGAINYDAEELYEKLRQRKEENEKSKDPNGNSNRQQENGNQGKSNGSGNQNLQNNSPTSESKSANDNSSNNIENANFDINGIIPPANHELWKKALKKTNNNENQDNLSDNNKKESNQNNSNTNSKNEDSKKESDTESDGEKKVKELTKKFANIGEKKAFAQNKIERTKVLEELKKSLAQEASNHGNITNMEQRKVDNIGISKPLIDWRRLLRETITYDNDWSYQNATIEDGCVVPHLEDIPKPVTEIVLDTSGSIDETLLRNFLRECKNIFTTSKVKVGCFDTKFYGFQEIRNINDIDTFPLVGFGGTDFDVAVNAFSKRVENKIIFTDGYADMPSKKVNAIWVVFGNDKINPPGGKVIYIDSEALERLSGFSSGYGLRRKF